MTKPCTRTIRAADSRPLFFFGLVLGALFLATAAPAQMVNDCGIHSHPLHVVEPATENARSFADGRVVITHLINDQRENARFLQVLHPDPRGGAACSFVSSGSSELGFEEVQFDRITAEYDPRWGLSIHVPVRYRFADGTLGDPYVLDINVNQASGGVDVRIVGEPE